MKVLLAEDGRVNQMVAVKLLEDRGHSVVLAVDGQVAVDLHLRERFDAILMDVQMPRLDGYAATAAIQAALGGAAVGIAGVAAAARTLSRRWR